MNSKDVKEPEETKTSEDTKEEEPYIDEESELYKLYPDLYKAIFIHKRNVLISGNGGTGKSYTIKLIKKESEKREKQCDLTSTTGVSAHALGLGATTLHRWSGIKLGDKPLETIITSIKKNPQQIKRWKECDILVIDEVSMLGSNVLSLVSQVGQIIRYGKKGIKSFLKQEKKIPPFGGLQIIMSADFMQLQPVKDKYAFKSPVWKELDILNFRLTTPYRYPDIKHFEMLSRIRVGKHTEDDINLLRTRVAAYEEYRKKERNNEIKVTDIKPTRIYPLKKDVEDINMMELNRLKGDPVIYEADDKIIIKTDKDGKPLVNPDLFNTKEYIEYMNNVVSPELILKKDAQVMLTINLSVEDGLVNGARGIVEECLDDRITVKFKCGTVVDIKPNEYDYEDELVTVIRCQFPLILASAITTHKSQGSTLDYAIIDLGTSLFAKGMGYVMLSRCKTLDGIFIVNLIPEKLKADEEALAFDCSMNIGT